MMLQHCSSSPLAGLKPLGAAPLSRSPLGPSCSCTLQAHMLMLLRCCPAAHASLQTCRPIVDHAVVHKENMAKMKAAYDAGKAAAAATATAEAGAAAGAADGASGSGGGKVGGSKAKAGDKPAKRARKS